MAHKLGAWAYVPHKQVRCPTILTCALCCLPACAGVVSVLQVLSGSEQDAVAPTVHWLEFAVAQLVHVRPNLQVGGFVCHL